MEVLIVLLLISVVVAGCFVAAFLWAVRSKQFDDLSTPAVRMLFEEPTDRNEEKMTHEQRRGTV